MKHPVHISKRVAAGFAMAAVIVVVTVLLESGRGRGQATAKATSQDASPSSHVSLSDATVDLSASQLSSIKIEPVGTFQFPVEKETVGTISFADELSVQ